MKLVNQTHIAAWEREFACPAEQAVSLMQRAFRARHPTSGLQGLRRTLALNSEAGVLNKLRQKQWLLIKDEAYYFDWGATAKAAQEQRFAQSVTALLAAPPVQYTKGLFEFHVTDSETIEPLVKRQCDFRTNGGPMERKTDKAGMTYLSLHVAPTQVVVQLTA